MNLTVYDSASITATAAWVVSTNTDQAYAHPIDGFKLDSVSLSYIDPIIENIAVYESPNP